MRQIEGFEKYFVTKDGKVFSGNKELKQYVKKNKARGETYKQVFLYKGNSERKCMMVHRLVALAFIDNPLNKRTVNHIDGNKQNNHVSNLEWCTDSENAIHAFKNNLRVGKNGKDSPHSKKVSCYKLSGEYVATFFSAREAVKQGYAIEFKNVSAVCRGKRKSHNGYIWKFDETKNA